MEFSNGFLLSLSLCLDIGIANIATVSYTHLDVYKRQHQPRPLLREFGRGVVLAMSSPTAILWFATVGGALISRMGHHSLTGTSWFLSGFFIAGMFWTCVLCLVGSFGGRMLGQRLLKYSYIASALIFSYFALYVIVSGYREFMVA
ncbi:hypothetical protein EKH82_24010 [Pantoea dispersa]|nr:hypothetical protein EKH82_24010 [Pantoea dispersa]